MATPVPSWTKVAQLNKKTMLTLLQNENEYLTMI
jgi:hypothetical protein